MKMFDRLSELSSKKQRCVYAFAMLLTLLLSPPVFGQSEFKTFPLNLRDVSLFSALETINELSGGEVMFKKEEVEKERKRVTLRLNQVNTMQAVDTCLKNTSLTTMVQNNMVVVIPRTSITVSGRVTDLNGHSLPGATVVGSTVERGRSEHNIIGVSADHNGYYRITLPIGVTHLTATFVGYVTETKAVNDRTHIDFLLREEEQEIGEVVVTGIYTRTKESFTGSVASFRKEDIQRVGSVNIFQALKNLDPSLKVLENEVSGSDPNVLPEMYIRGRSNFDADMGGDLNLKSTFANRPNNPLFILDGFEVSIEQIYDLDINRIESVTILKDAAAKAIYGSKAANGVVVFETNTFAAEGVRVSFNISSDVEMPDLTSYNLMNAEEKLQAEMLDGTVYETDKPEQMDIYNQHYKLMKEGFSQDWLTIPVRVGYGGTYALSVEMGTREISTMINLRYTTREAAMKGSSRKNLELELQNSYRKGTVLLRNSATILRNKSRNSPYGSFSAYASANPYSPAYDEKGDPNKYIYAGTNLEGSPLWDAHLNQKDQSSYFLFQDRFTIEWRPVWIEGLLLTGKLGLTYKQGEADRFYPYSHSRFFNTERENYYKRGSYRVNNTTESNIEAQLTASYNRLLGETHFLQGVLGWSLTDNSLKEYYSIAQGYRSESTNEYQYGSMYEEGGRPGGSISRSRTIAPFFNLLYTYDQRFNVEFSYRLNGSSAFGLDNRWESSWSVGGSWNVHRERFMENSGVSQFRLRGSYGYTGNQNFDGSRVRATYRFYDDAYNYYWPGAVLTGMENPQLKMQLERQLNVGVDLTIKRVTLKVDRYITHTENNVTDISIAASTGFRSVYENLGTVRNRGWEFNLSLDVLRTKDWTVSLYGYLHCFEGKLMELSDAMDTYNKKLTEMISDTDQAVTTPVTLYYEGVSLREIWAVPSLGIDPQDGYEMFINKDGILTKQWNSADLRPYGSSDSKYDGNFGLNLFFRNLDLNVSMRYHGGSKKYNQTLVDKVENADYRYNADRRALHGRWQEPGDQVQFRRIVNNYRHPVVDVRTETDYTRATSRFVQKNNELNLAAISMTYTFNPVLLRKIGMSQLKLSANMNEIAKWSTMGVERGTDYPFARTLSVKLSGSF